MATIKYTSHTSIQSFKRTQQQLQTYMYACDFYIESVRIQHKGYFYIQWKRGKKIAQTLKHQNDGKNVAMKETLTLNISLTSKNGRTVQKNTVLSIINAEEEEIDQITIPIHKWSQQYSSLEFQLAKGLLKAKVRRRQLLQIRNPPTAVSYINSDAEQQSSYIQQQMNMKMMIPQSSPKNPRVQIDSHRDQITKIKKQLQDTLYVNNKLKNDRSVLLTRNLQLQSELNLLKKQIKQGIEQLQKYYKNKIQIRETIYEDEINNIITAFNSNTEYNFIIVKNIIEENRVLEDENKEIKRDRENLRKELEEYEVRIMEIEREKDQLRKDIKTMGQNIEILNTEKINNDKMRKQIQETLIQAQAKGQQKDHEIQRYKQQISLAQKNKLRLQVQLQDLKFTIQKLGIANQNLQSQLQSNKYQLQFTQQTYRKQKQENENKEEMFRTHIKKLEGIIKEYEENQIKFEGELAKEDQLKREIENTRREVSGMKENLENANEEIKNLTKKCSEQKQYYELKIRQIEGQKEECIRIKLQQSISDSNIIKEKSYKISELSDQVDALKVQLQQLKKQIKQLSDENAKLREQKQFMNENAIKVEDYQQLQQKVLELEARLAEQAGRAPQKQSMVEAERQKQEKIRERQNSISSLDKKGKGKKDSEPSTPRTPRRMGKQKAISGKEEAHKEKPLKQIKQLSEKKRSREHKDKIIIEDEKQLLQNKNLHPIEKIKVLEDQLTKYKTAYQDLNKENQELKVQQDLLTVEMAKVYAREMELKKKLQTIEPTETKIIEYCPSQDEENRLLEEHYEKLTANESKKIQQYRDDEEDDLSLGQKKRSNNYSLPSKTRKSQKETLQQKQKERQRESKLKVRKSATIMDPPSAKKYKFQRQNSIVKEQSQENSKDYSYIPHKNSDQYHVLDEVHEEQVLDYVDVGKGQLKKSKSIKQQKSIIIPKTYQNDELNDSNQREALSNKSGKSNQSNSQGDMRSRQSFISGTTLYKFQKVSHREKIAKLEGEIEEQRVHIEEHMKKIEALTLEIQKYKQQTIFLERELRIIDQDRHSLKASLHVELQRRNIQRYDKKIQTEKLQRNSVWVQANIIIEDPQKISLANECKKLVREKEHFQIDVGNKLRDSQNNYKALVLKLENMENKYEELHKKYREKADQNEKLKKETKILQDKDIEYRNTLHTMKLSKSQLQFELSKYQSQNKKFKDRVQDLQEKLKKSDVMDQFRQTQFQLEASTKKIVDLNRQLYQLKLEKDTIEDEMKLLRKKNGDISKKSSQLQDTVEKLQKNIDEQKRKQGRFRRDLQEKEDNVEKLRDQIKRLNEEISMLKGINNEQVFERKKFMDETTNLGNTIERKEYQVFNLKKQLQKLRQKLVEKEQEKNDRKNGMKKEIQRLQLELTASNKEIIELESISKQLNNKLEYLMAENKKSMNEKSLFLTEKLRSYEEEIGGIKKISEDYNIENSNLKYRLNECLEQNETLKSNINKIEQRYTQQIENNKQLAKALENERIMNEKIREKLSEMELQVDGFRSKFKTTKIELQKEKKDNAMKKEQIDQLTKANDGYLQQINKNKVKISDYETELQINKNYNEKLTQTDKQLRNITKQLRQAKRIYDEYRAKYVHTPMELQNVRKSIETKWKEKLQETIEAYRTQQQNQISLQKKKFEGEIVDLLNEITRLRTESSKKSEEISQLLFKISKLQILPIKLEEIQKLYAEKTNECNRYRAMQQANQGFIDKLNKLEDVLSKTNTNKNELTSNLMEIKAQNKELQDYVSKWQITANNLQQENITLQEKVSQHIHNQASFKEEIQKLLKMNKVLQDEKNSILSKMQENRKGYNEKIRNLEEKLDLMGSTVNQHEKALSSHYEKNIEDIKIQLQHMYEEMQGKDKAITDMEEVISKLEVELEAARREIAEYKEKQLTDAQIFEMEYNKMKNKMSDNERAYKSTINNLQLELEDMSREMTSLKLRQASVSRVPEVPTNDQNSSAINIKRLEEKIRQKDTKIQQLKQNTFVLEETIVKLKKKQQNTTQYTEKIAKLQKENFDLANELKRLQDQLQKLQSKDITLYQSLKNEINNLKNINEKMKISLQEKEMENTSLRYELQTTKELYAELQKQLDKRKNLYREKTESQSKFIQQMYTKDEYINRLQQSIQQMKIKQTELIEQVSKKSQMIVILQEKTTNLQKIQTKLKNTTKVSTERQHYQNQIKRLSEENEILIRNNKKLKDQIQMLEKDNYETKFKLNSSQSSIDTLNSTLEEVSYKCRDLEQNMRRYQDINEICFKIFHVNLDQAIYQGYINQKLQEKDTQINSLLEEIEQLKFLNERKMMDFDELKKQNYELQLKLDDAQFAVDQVDQLRRICDKLQQEKKDAIFRQEVLKLQIESILESGPNEMRERIEKIKYEELVRRMSNSGTHTPRLSFA